MRLNRFLIEASMKNIKAGLGLTLIDIDETTFKTFAMIKVIKDGKVIRELDNQEFNTYELNPGESFDFGEFRNAELFSKTSIPIDKTIDRIKRMISRIKAENKESRIVFLTARSDFDDKHTFLKKFEEHGISMDMPTVYVERTGNLKTGTVAERKRQVILKYLKTGLYRRVRLIDDDMKNLKVITDIEKTLPIEIEQKVRERYNLGPAETAIEFYALHVDPNGNLKQVNR